MPHASSLALPRGVAARAAVAVLGVLAMVLAGLAAPPQALGATSTTFNGSLDASGTSWRVHSFSVTAPASIDVVLTWSTDANLNLFLRDPSVTTIARSTQTTGTQERVTVDVSQSGTYSIGIKAISGTADYTATVTLGDPSGASDGRLLRYSKSMGFYGPAGTYPYGLDFDFTSDTVLVGDYWNSKVKRYTKDGQLLGVYGKKTARGVPGGMCFPYDIESDTSGNIWIADQDCSRVVILGPDGEYLRTIGQGGTPNYPSGCGGGSMLIPTHLVVHPDTGRVFISDPRCRMVYMFQNNGTFIGQFDFPAAGNKLVPIPRGIDLGADGNVYVADQNNKAIVVFDTNGSFVRQFKPTDWRFRDLRGLTIDRTTGAIHVVASYYNNLFVFTPEGTQLARIDRIQTPGGTLEFKNVRWPTVDEQGNIWVSDLYEYRTYRLGLDGVARSWVQAPEPPPDGGFRLNRDVALDPANRLFVIDTFEQRVQRFDPNQACTGPTNCPAFELAWGSRQIAGETATGFGYPRAMAWGTSSTGAAAGSIWVGDNNNAVLEYTTDGAFVSRIGTAGTAPGQFKGGVQGIDVDATRVVTSDVINCRVQVFSLTGQLLAHMGSCGSGLGQMNGPRGLDLAGDHAYVLDTGNRRIAVWDLNTRSVDRYLTPTCDGKRLLDARFLTFDPAQRWLYVSDGQNYRVVRVDPTTGACTVASTGSDTPQGKFGSPRGIEFGPDGRLYVSDDSQRVYVFEVI